MNYELHIASHKFCVRNQMHEFYVSPCLWNNCFHNLLVSPDVFQLLGLSQVSSNLQREAILGM